MLKYYIGATLVLLITIGLLYVHTGRLKEDNQSLRDKVSLFESQIVGLQQELTLSTLAKEAQERVLLNLQRENREADIVEQGLLSEIDKLYLERKRNVPERKDENGEVVQICYPYSAVDYGDGLREAYNYSGK